MVWKRREGWGGRGGKAGRREREKKIIIILAKEWFLNIPYTSFDSYGVVWVAFKTY